MSEVLIAGGGAWGCALALQAMRAGHQVTLAVRTPQALQAGRPFPRLPGHPVPPALRVMPLAGIGAEAASADAVFAAVPMAHLRATLRLMQPPRALLLCCKGVEHDSNFFAHEVARAVLPAAPHALLSGPNFAEGIADGAPAAAVIAGGSEALRDQLIALLATPGFRLYGNDDALGAAVGGAAKNVAAIAAGAVSGAGLGENARAALITRALAEITRLAVALGGRAETTAGLSGLGDLVLTCTGASSRNFRLGLALGHGKSVDAAMPADGSAVEGAYTAPALLARAQTGAVEMPIAAAVASLLDGRSTLAQAIAALLTRPRRDE